MHGSWGLEPSADGSFTVTNMQLLRNAHKIESAQVDLDRVNGLLAKINNLDGIIHVFIASKMWHAHLGLLQLDRRQSLDHPARQNPTKDDAP